MIQNVFSQSFPAKYLYYSDKFFFVFIFHLENKIFVRNPINVDMGEWGACFPDSAGSSTLALVTVDQVLSVSVAWPAFW